MKFIILFCFLINPLVSNSNETITNLEKRADDNENIAIKRYKMYENNIKQHYIEYVERYVNVMWKKNFMKNKIQKLNITKKEKDSRINNFDI